MTSTSTISTRIVSRIARCLTARGHRGDLLCRRVGIDPMLLRDVGARVPFDRYLSLWRLAVEESGDPLFPLEVARSGVDEHNILRFVCMSCPTLRDALANGSQYLPVVTDGVTWSTERRGDRFVVGVNRPGPFAPEHALADLFAVAEIVSLARAFTGTAWAPYEVCFAGTAPRETERLRVFVRAPLAFGAPRTEIHVDERSLSLPLVRADRATADFFELHAQRMIQDYGGGVSFSEVVRARLERRLAEGTSAAEMARDLALSERTLRRRLAAEGVSFRSLVAGLARSRRGGTRGSRTSTRSR